MRRIVYDVAVSLDGFICGPDDDSSAFPAEGDHVDAYMERLAGYGTVVMGRRTYEFGYRFGLEPGARAYPHMEHHIFSRTLTLPEPSEVAIVRDDWPAHLAALREAPGSDIYLCGGGAFAGLVTREGLLDCLRLKIAPITLGRGVGLFGADAPPLTLRRTELTSHTSGVVFAEYVVEA